MKILLDTHAFLWAIADAPSLSRAAKDAFEDEENELLLSLASTWEMAIKISLGKLTLGKPLDVLLPEQMARNSIVHLSIESRHAFHVAALPFHHRDPFDRLLAAQCLVDDLTLLSANPVFDRYGVRRVWG